MLVRCTLEFRDLKTAGKPMRRVGDEWEATAERLRELSSTRYGKLAEAVEETAESPETATAARKAATPKKGTATRKTARKSAQEG